MRATLEPLPRLFPPAPFLWAAVVVSACAPTLGSPRFDRAGVYALPASRPPAAAAAEPPTTLVGPGSSVAGEIFVAPEAQAFRIATPPSAARAVPGFFHGVDLRAHRSVAFVVDVGPARCTTREGAPIAAAIAGLHPDARVTVIAAAGGFVSQYVPDGPAGRALVEAWLATEACRPGRSLALGLRRAFERGPEIVVLVSALDLEPATEQERVKREHPEDWLSFADELVEIPSWEGVAPILVVSSRRGNPRGPALAAATRGAYLSLPSPPPVAPQPQSHALPPLDPDPPHGTRIIIAPEAPLWCRPAGLVVGAAGRDDPRPRDHTQQAFEAWLPLEAARASARARAARTGADVLVIDAHATAEAAVPGFHGSRGFVIGRAFRCGTR